MKNVKRMLTGVAFTLVLAVTLMATTSEAYAKGHGGKGRQASSGATSPTAPSPSGGVNSLGVTWE